MVNPKTGLMVILHLILTLLSTLKTTGQHPYPSIASAISRAIAVATIFTFLSDPCQAQGDRETGLMDPSGTRTSGQQRHSAASNAQNQANKKHTSVVSSDQNDCMRQSNWQSWRALGETEERFQKSWSDSGIIIEGGITAN